MLMVPNPLIACPRCGSEFVVIAEEKVYCLRCRLIFSLSVSNRISPENILADDELEGIAEIITSMKSND